VIDGKKFNKQKDTAEEFNKYFAHAAEKIKERLISENYLIVNDSKNAVNHTDFMGQTVID
jgi:hypothetical protein